MDNKMLNLKFISILCFILSFINILGSLGAIYVNLYYNDIFTYLISSVNIIFAIVLFRIGQDIKQEKRWAFDWGLNIGYIQLIGLAFQLYSGNTSAIIFLPLWLLLLISLYKNSKAFGES